MFRLRFKLDGGLAEDFTCELIRRRDQASEMLRVIDAKSLRAQCDREFAEVTRSANKLFEPKDAVLICRSEEQIDAAAKSARESIRARVCP